MARPKNFLLGKGERLTEPVKVSGRPITRIPPYTFGEARTRLTPMFEHALTRFARLPELARPQNQVVSAVTLHPEYVTKSAYPNSALKTYGLRAVGSKPAFIKPDKRSGVKDAVERPTLKLFVAGSMASFRHFLSDLEDGAVSDAVQENLPAFETLDAYQSQDKIKGTMDGDYLNLEVVLHASEALSDGYILQAFEDYIKSLDLSLNLNQRFYSGGLCFVKLAAPASQISNIADFSFLRALREMPRLRDLSPLRGGSVAGFTVPLPAQIPVDLNTRVAVFDGGLSENSPLVPWVNRFDPPGIGAPDTMALDHGHAVTSALLFGPLSPDETVNVPFSKVDHIRVWDQNSGADQDELYDVLNRIKDTLDTSPKYEFINLSVGPQLTADDDDVHAWTSVLDEYLADGTCLATVAVGNNGKMNRDLGFNRIMVPADTVNGLAVGACNSMQHPWAKTDYSAVGPGRSPGIVKPDLVAFGGTSDTPYHVVSETAGACVAQRGTSFASPHVLRMGIGVRVSLGAALSPLAIRALLVHTAEPGTEPQSDIGWGKVRDSIEDIIICPDGAARILYQGELTASKYLRAAIPMPDEVLDGMIEISATCCFATEIDSAHPSSYTRSGLEIIFRPDSTKVGPAAKHAKTETVFSQSKLYDQTDMSLRSDAHKWETCLNGSIRKRATGLNAPVFDIHYMSRDEGHADHHGGKIKYALVITITSDKHDDFYDMIVRKYRNVLEAMTPIQVPITPTA